MCLFFFFMRVEALQLKCLYLSTLKHNLSLLRTTNFCKKKVNSKTDSSGCTVKENNSNNNEKGREERRVRQKHFKCSYTGHHEEKKITSIYGIHHVCPVSYIDYTLCAIYIIIMYFSLTAIKCNKTLSHLVSFKSSFFLF